MVRKAGSFISEASDSDFEVGPMEPATQIYLSEQLSATRRAMRAPSRAISATSCSQPYSCWLMRLDENVLVSMMSAPAST